MKEIKDIIANNLIALRKQNNLTQNELAEKLSYSDNMVSRWERGEVTPSVETLQKIAEFYAVPLTSLLQEKSVEQKAQIDKMQNIKKFSMVLLLITTAWLVLTIAFVYSNTILHKNHWKLFVLGVPLSCAILLLFNGAGEKQHIYNFVVLTVLLWSLLTFFYLFLLEYNPFLIFLIGVPIQLSLVIMAFIKPKKNRTKC